MNNGRAVNKQHFGQQTPKKACASLEVRRSSPPWKAASAGVREGARARESQEECIPKPSAPHLYPAAGI